jgi:hypothetical protein
MRFGDKQVLDDVSLVADLRERFVGQSDAGKDDDSGHSEDK